MSLFLTNSSSNTIDIENLETQDLSDLTTVENEVDKQRRESIYLAKAGLFLAILNIVNIFLLNSLIFIPGLLFSLGILLGLSYKKYSNLEDLKLELLGYKDNFLPPYELRLTNPQFVPQYQVRIFDENSNVIIQLEKTDYNRLSEESPIIDKYSFSPHEDIIKITELKIELEAKAEELNIKEREKYISKSIQEIKAKNLINTLNPGR